MAVIYGMIGQAIMKYLDLYPPDLNKPQRLYCDKCNGYLSLIYDSFKETVEFKDIQIDLKVNGLPYLYCDACKLNYLPDGSRIALIRLVEEAGKNNKNKVLVTRKKPKERFPYCKVSFIYDSDDYYYLPGLTRPNSVGFLTPVYFRRKVLLKYTNDPQYHIKMAGRTYGIIYKGTEYSIAFGINPKHKIIMWLGDIDTLPVMEQHYLRSENILSDHKIGSEFYDGQIECTFCKPSLESELIKAHSNMLENFSEYFHKRIFHLEERTLELIEELKSPVIYSQNEMETSFDILNKILIEGISNPKLEKLKVELNLDKEGKSLKTFQAILLNTYPKENIKSIMAPFFVLYDLRKDTSHLVTKQHWDETVNNAKKRLNIIQKKTDYELLYNALINQITESCNTISELLLKGPI